jgi:thioredoxin reductase
VILRDRESGATEEINVGGMFVFVGLQPNTQFLADTITLTEAGFIATSPTLETSQPGIFAAGDARAGSTKQLVSAAGEGATAALMIRQYLENVGSRARPEEARDPMVTQMAGLPNGRGGRASAGRPVWPPPCR